MLDNRLADPDQVHDPYRVVERAEWEWVDLDDDGVDEIRLRKHTAYYEPDEEGYVRESTSPFREEDLESVFRWDGTTFAP